MHNSEVLNIAQALTSKKKQIAEKFLDQEHLTALHDTGFDTKTLLREHSRAVDKAIRILWQTHFDLSNHHFTLCAVGGLLLL